MAQLAECLVKCDRMRHREGRDMVVEQLPERVGAITIKRADTDFDDALAIVSRCSQFPGGIESLIRVVHRFEKNSAPMKAVWRCLASLLMPNEVLELNQLAGFLRFSSAIQLTGEVVVSAYDASVPDSVRDHFRLSSPKESGLWVAMTELCDVTASGGNQPPCLLSFLHALTEFVKTDQNRKKYADWLSKVQARLGHKEVIKKKRINPRAKRQAPHVLLHLQSKSTQGGPNFHATVHISRGHRVSEPKTAFGGDQKRIVEALERWITSFFTDDDDQPECVEVFLPCKQLFEIEPHRWKTCQDPDSLSSILGRDFPTVVRLDRRRKAPVVRPPYRKEWKRKWRRFQELASATTSCQETWRRLREIGADDKTLNGCGDPWVREKDADDLISLRDAFRTRDAAPVMLAPFQPKSLKNRPDLAQVVLESGIPVALWGDASQGDMEKLLEKIRLKNFPADLKEVRLKANAPEDKPVPRESNPDACVTLLWDDPQRELPAILHEPEKTEFTDDGLYGPQ